MNTRLVVALEEGSSPGSSLSLSISESHTFSYLISRQEIRLNPPTLATPDSQDWYRSIQVSSQESLCNKPPPLCSWGQVIKSERRLLRGVLNTLVYLRLPESTRVVSL